MLIEVKGLVKGYQGRKVLDGINLNYSTDNIYGLFGRNGAGKSTLLRCITGLTGFDAGSVTVAGEDIAKLHDYSLLAISNDDNLLPSSTRVESLIASFAAWRGVDEEGLRDDAKDCSINLRCKWEKLSTGERTLMKDIMALGSGAAFIFLDEPVLGVDAVNRDWLYKRVIEASSPTTAVILSSHIIDEAASLVSFVHIIDHGRIILEGSSEEIQDQAWLARGTKEEIDAVKGDFSVLARGQELGLETMCLLGHVEDPGTASLEKADLQRLFVEMTRGGER